MMNKLKHNICPGCHQCSLIPDGALQVCACGFSRVIPGEFDDIPALEELIFTGSVNNAKSKSN